MNSHSRLVVRQDKPFNAGPPLELLGQSKVTPNDLFFVRNHGDIPTMDAARYRLTVDGLVPHTISLSLEDLRSNFSKVTVEATLQCAGNRRQELMAVQPIPGELGWDAEAISNAVWTGVPLQEVLTAAGLDRTDEPSRHVALAGLDTTERQNRRFNFGGSIPLEKALGREVILAYEMNGEPLTPAHGFPLRLVVPGYIGARSVKWLSRITLQAAPSDNYFQAQAYRLFPPHAQAESVDWSTGLMLGETSVNAVICSPVNLARIPAGAVVAQGYAAAGGGRRIERVDISSDGGNTWLVAELCGPAARWSWRLWQARLDLEPGQHEIVVRAVDSAANMQPEAISSVWNFKGYMNNAWHRIQLSVR